ncbi:zinc-binding dehydrogenase [Pararhizobium sp. LjRoot238]
MLPQAHPKSGQWPKKSVPMQPWTTRHPTGPKELTGGRGADLIMETAGGDNVNRALNALAPFGRMVFLGQSSGKSAQIDPWRLTTFNHTVTGIYISAYAAFPDLMAETMNELIGFLMAGKLSINIGKVMRLSQAAEAHRLFGEPVNNRKGRTEALG